MAARADQIHDSKAGHPQRDPKAPARPLKTRVTSTSDLIKRSLDKHRETLEILAKR